MNKLILSRQRVSSSDLSSVVYGGYQVVLDSAVMEKLKSDWNNARDAKNPIVPLENSLGNKETNQLEDAKVRAAIVALLVTLLHGKCLVRTELLEKLAEWINNHVTPCVYEGNQEEMMTQLIQAVRGAGVCRSKDGALINASNGLDLSQREIDSLKKSLAFAVGLATLSAYAFLELVAANDAVACLTIEAIPHSIASFDTSNYDVSHPHKGAMTCASNVRALCEGSRNIDESKKDLEEICIRDMPLYCGTARDVMEHANRSLVVEFNSAMQPHASFSHAPISVQVSTLFNAGLLVLSGSLARAKLVAEPCYLEQLNTLSIASPTFAPANLEALVSEFSRLVFLIHEALTLEAASALHRLAVKERVVFEAAEKKKAGKEIPKEFQNLQKDDKKKEKKEKKKGLVLGNGIKVIRNYLNPQHSESDEFNLYAVPELSDVKDFVSFLRLKLNPFESTFTDLVTPMLSLSSGSKKPKIPKGTRDVGPEQMAIRENAFKKILEVFRRHGAVGIDTPVFELKETLTGKYGEDSKLIYDLADQGGEMLSLRYDLTVPFARYLALAENTQIKRYHIAKVYRRDNPAMNRGRFREFYQCDYDVSGTYGSMIPDSDVLKVVTEILTDLKIGAFVVKLNHRIFLDAMMEICGVPASKFRTICSAIDKLDKETWDTVKDEMVYQKGLDASVAEKIGEYVREDRLFVKLKSDPIKVLQLLKELPEFSMHAKAKVAFAELDLLFRYLDAMKCLHLIHFDLSLARGLDYYTGVIYEAVLTEAPYNRVGSIAAGGRYDGLIGRFSGSDVPAVGVSVGIERILTIMEEQAKLQGAIRSTTTSVLVCSIGANMLESRMKVCEMLWSAGIHAEFMYKENPKLPIQLGYADESKIPYAVIFGSSEVESGIFKVKNLVLKEEVDVPKDNLIAYFKNLGL